MAYNPLTDAAKLSAEADAEVARILRHPTPAKRTVRKVVPHAAREALVRKFLEAEALRRAQWKRESAERRRVKQRGYEAAKDAARAKRIPAWFGEFDSFVVQEAYALAALRPGGGAAWQVDHMLPLQGRMVSGLHCGLNLQVIPKTMNLAKHNHARLTQPGEWLCHV